MTKRRAAPPPPEPAGDAMDLDQIAGAGLLTMVVMHYVLPNWFGWTLPDGIAGPMTWACFLSMIPSLAHAPEGN